MTKNLILGGRPSRGPAAKLRRFLRRGAADEGGAAAVFFAVCLLLLAPLSLGLVDVYMATTQRGQLLDALDTATLYVARSKETDPEKLNAMGLKVLRANLNLPSGQTVASSSFVLVDGRKIVSEAQITPPSFAPKFWTQNNLKANSEVTRNSVNLEVAIVLDTTGSMSDEMTNLRTAAKDLVDLVVQDVQTPYYSKAALIPYAASVNVGTYANTVRGPLRQATAITGITRANPAVVTSPGHGLANGERIWISGVNGITNDGANLNREWLVAGVTQDTFQLKTLSGNNKDTRQSEGWSVYSSGGAVQCVAEGCQYFSFDDDNGNRRRFYGRPCVTERVSGEKYTDAAPSTALVGRNYAGTSLNNIGASNTGCGSAAIVPLSSSKADLKTAITNLNSYGYTAGHIGLAWGWYMVSPLWNTVFTGSNAPASYTAPETVKVVVLMTDGAFNTAYCKGVIAGNSSSNNDNQINCDATNGNPFDQAETLCANMKAKGIVLYTVGFNVGDDTNVTDLMQACASKPENVYLPSGGTALKDAFKAIGQDINRLRISK